jgi:stage V sporulation protein B
MTKTKTLIINTLILTSTSVIVSVIGMYFNVHIAKQIGAEAMGIFTLLTSVYMFAITLATSGIGLATTKLIAEEVAFGRFGGVRRMVARCFAFALIMGIFAATILILSADIIGNNFLHSVYTIRPLKVLAIALPFLAMSSVFTGYFIAMGYIIRNASALIIEQFVRVVVCVQILAYFMVEHGIEGACLAIVLSGVASEVFSFTFRGIIYLRARRKMVGGDEGAGGGTGRMLKLTLPLAFSSYLRSALSTTKHVMMPIFLAKSGMLASEALAQYGIIQGMVVPLLLFPACFLNAASNLLVPEIAQLRVLRYKARICSAVSRVFRIALVYSIGVCGVLFFYADALAIGVYNNPDAAIYIRLLSLCVPIIYFDNIVDGLLKGLDRQVRVMQINILDSIAVIAMIMLILPRFGIAGFILVFYLSELFNITLSVICLLRTTACSFNIKEWVIKPLVAIGVAIGTVFMIGEVHYVIGMGVMLCIYAVVWFGLLKA